MREPGSTGSILSKHQRTPALTVDLNKLPHDVRNRFPDDASTTEVRQPHSLYLDDGRGETIITQGSHWIHTPLDGITLGRRAKDLQGREILDANGNYILIQTGLLRPLALDEQGRILRDADGHLCFVDIGNQQKDFDTPPSHLDPSIFLSSWHPATQIEYIRKHNKGANDNDFLYTSIGSGKNKITACITADLKSVYIAEVIQIGDVMGMSRKDQENLTKLPNAIFDLEIKTKLGITTRQEAKSPDGIYVAIQEYMASMKPEDKPAAGSETDDCYMSEENVNLFKKQFQILLDEMDSGELVNTAAINDAREDIANRYEIAKSFSLGAGDVHPETTLSANTVPQHVRSQDHGASIKETFTKLINYERNILQQTYALRKMRINSNRYDLPVLIARYQTGVHHLMELKNSANTEVADQINDLIGVYTRMQNIINQVSSRFKTKSGEHDPEEYSLGGYPQGQEGPFPGNLGHVHPTDLHTPAGDAYIAAMFGKENRSLHPIEKFYGISRPELDNLQLDNSNKELFDLLSKSPDKWPDKLRDRWLKKLQDEGLEMKMKPKQKTFYDTQSTQLSGTINILNQKAQSLLNKISSIENKAVRHFEMANNALNKMNELVLTISRNVA